MPRYLPYFSSAIFGSLARFRHHRRDPAGRRKQGSRLGRDDREILILVRLDAALGGQLLDLALGNDRRGVAKDLEHAQAAVLDHQFEGAAEQEVADQNGRRIAPDKVGGPLAAAKAGAVDDIVVKQGRGVNELDRRGELLVPGAAISEQRRDPSVSIGRILLPPPAIRCPASSGISPTLLCILSRMTAFTPCMSSATSAISGSSDGA